MKFFFEIYPYLTPEQKPIEVTQHAGEMIYIPPGWWHCVLNLEETVSVTQNFVNENNLELNLLYLYNYRHFPMLKYFKKKIN